MPMQALSYRHRKQLRVLHELYDLAWFQSTIIMFTILATPEGHISCLRPAPFRTLRLFLQRQSSRCGPLLLNMASCTAGTIPALLAQPTQSARNIQQRRGQ